MNPKESFDRIYKSLTLLETVDVSRLDPALSYRDILYINLILLTPGCTVSKLAEMLRVSLPTVTRRINTMEERGIVVRRKQEGDGRFKTIELSDRLMELFGDQEATVAGAMDDLAEAYSAEEVERFCEMLDFVVERVERSSRERGEGRRRRPRQPILYDVAFMGSPPEGGVDPMDREQLTPHIEEIKRAIGNGIDDETIVTELNKYLVDYHVDLESAKRGIIRKYRKDTGFATASNAVKKIADLNGTENNVDIVAKIVYVETKNITVKGLNKSIVSGILGDDTGTASFTVWEPGSIQMEKGAVYNFRNCYCKLWNERVQVNIGNRGRVEPAPGVELDVPAGGASLGTTEVSIGDIREGMGNVTVTGKILSVEARKINSRGEEKIVYSGIIADETGKIQFSAWHDFDLREGIVVCAKNCYIRSWKGIPQLNIGDRADVTVVNTQMDVDDSASLKTIADINRIGGGLDITVEGVVVDMKNGSGLIKRCPQCNRSLMAGGVCTVHGEVDGVQDMRMKLVVDDGTGAIGAIVNRTDTEKLTGVSMNSAVGLAAARGEGVVARELMGRILLRRVRITGNVMSDDYGPSMIVRSASTVEVDVQAEAEKLLEEVEAAI